MTTSRTIQLAHHSANGTGPLLVQLADSPNVHKSAASRVLHRAEGRIITEFVAAASSSGRRVTLESSADESPVAKCGCRVS